MRNKRHLSIRIAIAAALATTSAAIMPPAAASAGERYVALGDSFTAGPLIPNQRGGPAGCLRSDHNYASLVAAGLGANLTDVSCSGAATADMTAAQHTSDGVNPPQLDALTADTTLVTLGIGGNDIGFGDISLTCGLLSFTNPFGSPCERRYGDRYERRIKAVEPRVAAVLDEIRRRSPRAEVLVVGYLRLMPARRGCWPMVPIASGDAGYLDRTERALNAMLERVAGAGGAAFVDTYAGGARHDVCARAADKWAEGVFITAPAAPIHPNATGMRAVAGRVLDRLKA